MDSAELKKIIENHQHWINEDVEGWESMKADLGGADLGDANLGGANLGGANLRHANLGGANLGGADLRYADLEGADLGYADLGDANLGGADLGGANLVGANLGGADLVGANLVGADLVGANLVGANLVGAKYNAQTAFFALQCPEEGSFIAWKKVGCYVVKLRVPEDAKRSSATSRKCRCSHAEVLEIQDVDGTNANMIEVVNMLYVPAITYKVGEIVHADEWDEDRWNECSHGIHFFITRGEAVNY